MSAPFTTDCAHFRTPSRLALPLSPNHAAMASRQSSSTSIVTFTP